MATHVGSGNRGGHAGPSSSQPAEQPLQKKPKHANGTATEQPLLAAAQQALANEEKSQKKRKRMEAKLQQAAEPSSGQEEQAAAAADQLPKKKKKDKTAASEPTALGKGAPAIPTSAGKEGAAARKQAGAPGGAAGDAVAAPKKKGANAAAKGSAGRVKTVSLEGPELKSWREDYKRTNVKHGKFSSAERDAIRQAVKEYAEAHQLSQTDLDWLYCTRKSSAEARKRTEGAWISIAAALPHRKAKAVWSCGTRMLHLGNYKGKWTAEDVEKLKELHAAKGDRWVEMGASLGRLPEAVRDKFRTLKLGDARKAGAWTPEEEGKLTELVSNYLAKRPAEERVSGRIVLDDLPWDAISCMHGSRDPDQCRNKWTGQLSPSMVDRGDWGVGDDRRLLKSLFRSGAANIWELDWGALVPGRAAAMTRRRWRLMLKCVPDGADKGFDECVDFLVEKYTPDLKTKGEKGNAAADGAASPAEAA